MTRLLAASCLDVLRAEPDASIDAHVCDWPAGVAFMGRAWDRDHGGRDAWVRRWAEVAAEMRRVAKPGAYALVWALPRTSHWTATALDDGGWQIQDVITHVFGQGWPKGRSALKPASEHWILARNGSGGALQIDAARVARGERMMPKVVDKGIANEWGRLHNRGTPEATTEGSWPPNFVMSHCPECEERGVRRVKGSAPASGPTLTGPSSSAARGRFNGTAATPSYGEVQEVAAFDCLAACDCGLSHLAPGGGAPPRCACGAAMWWACPVAEMDRQSGHLHARGNVTAKTHDRADSPVRLVNSATSYERGDPGDSGGASRFFPRFSPDILAKHGTMSGTQEVPSSCEYASSVGQTLPRSGERNGSAGTSAAACTSPGSAGKSGRCGSPAHDAEQDSTPSPGTSEGSAPSPAQTLPRSPRARRVRSAASPCASCETASAPSDAATPRGLCPGAIRGAPSTPDHRRLTPCPSPASDAARPVPIGTTTTIPSPRPSSGFAPDATSKNITSSCRVELASDPIDLPSRSFYMAKASSGERHAGCENLYWRADKSNPFGFSRITRAEWEALPEYVPTDERGRDNSVTARNFGRAQGNVHPTVKSIALMRWLVSLVAPPGGRLCDVTVGSGGTAIAWYLEELARGREADFIGCDICPEAIEIAEARLAWWRAQSAVQTGLFGEHALSLPEPVKPTRAKPARAAEPTAPDPRQKGWAF